MKLFYRKASIHGKMKSLYAKRYHFEDLVFLHLRKNQLTFWSFVLLLYMNFFFFPTRYTNFDLYGVSNHYGTMDGGHYTGFCKSSITKTWYKFDDHEVYELSRESVRSSAAYILFYEASNMSIKVNSLI